MTRNSISKETNKLLNKVESILDKLGIQSDLENREKINKEKDEFYRLRFNIRQMMNLAETYFQQKTLLLKENDAKNILEKQSIQKKLDTLLESINKNLNQLQNVYESQKKNKKKYHDTDQKLNILKGLISSYEILKGINDGNEPSPQTEFPSHRNLVERLTLGKENKLPFISRDINVEEEEKITDWKKNIDEQDKNVRDIVGDIRILGKEAKYIGEKQEEIGVKIGKTDKMASKTDQKLKGNRKTLHGLLEKFKAPDKFCIDIILCCICLGLIAILYYLIKSKFFQTKTIKADSGDSYINTYHTIIIVMMFTLYI